MIHLIHQFLTMLISAALILGMLLVGLFSFLIVGAAVKITIDAFDWLSHKPMCRNHS